MHIVLHNMRSHPLTLCCFRFAEEAGRVLLELGQFAALEQQGAAQFTAGIAAEMGRLFALPA